MRFCPQLMQNDVDCRTLFHSDEILKPPKVPVCLLRDSTEAVDRGEQRVSAATVTEFEGTVDTLLSSDFHTVQPSQDVRPFGIQFDLGYALWV